MMDARECKIDEYYWVLQSEYDEPEPMMFIAITANGCTARFLTIGDNEPMWFSVKHIKVLGECKYADTPEA